MRTDKERAVPLTADERAALEMDLGDEESGALRVAPFLWFLAAAAGYLPLAGILGFCTFSASGKYFAGSFADPFIYFAFYWAVLYGALVWPVSQFAYGQVSAFPLRAKRVLTLSLLLAGPLLSYGYYRGGLRDLFAFHELFVAVVPVVVVAALAFEQNQRRWLTSLILCIGTFVPFFLVNDILGDMPTYFKYASSGAGFYALRTLGPLTGIVLAFATLKSPPEETVQWRELRWGGFVLMGYGLLVSFLLPVLAASMENSAWQTYFRADLHLPVVILSIVLLGLKSRRDEMLKLIGVAEAVILTVQMGRVLVLGQFTFWELSRVLYWGVLALYFGLLAYRVARSRLPVPQVRE